MRTSFWCFGLALCLVGAACSSEKAAPQPVSEAGAARAALLQAIAARERAVQNYALTGEATDLESNETSSFGFKFRAPGLTWARLEAAGKELAYDGARLIEWDSRTKKRAVRDMRGVSDAERLVFLHQVFGPFVSEGWRPPLFNAREGGATVTFDRVHGPAGDEKAIRIDVPVGDAALEKVSYFVRPTTADFLLRKDIAPGGAVVMTRVVLEEHADGRSGLRFPKAWERRDRTGRAVYRATLNKIEVNQGVATDVFTPGGGDPAAKAAAAGKATTPHKGAAHAP